MFLMMQRLQPNLIAVGIWHKKFHVYQAQRIQRKIKKLRIFSFIPQRQRIQPNSMKETISISIHTKQPNQQTQPEQPKQRHRRGFHY